MRGHALDLGKEHERQRKETGFHGKTIAVFADNYASRNYGLYQDCDVGSFVVCLPPDIREYDALIGHVIDQHGRREKGAGQTAA